MASQTFCLRYFCKAAGNVGCLLVMWSLVGSGNLTHHCGITRPQTGKIRCLRCGIGIDSDVSENRGALTPEIIHSNRVWNHYKPSILGFYPLVLETSRWQSANPIQQSCLDHPKHTQRPKAQLIQLEE